MNRNIFASVAVAACCVLSCSQPKPASDNVQDRISDVEKNLFAPVRIEGEGPWTIEERLAVHKIHGVSIAVIRDYKLDWAKAYGWADSAEQRAVTTETVFQAASISKSLNAVGLLKLAQDGKVALDTDINTYLTSWKFPYDSASHGKKITITNLLSHTAGLTVHGFGGYAPGDSLPTIIEILNGKKPANSDAVRSMREPDQAPIYSGGGTTISQLIAMDVTGQPYDVFMEQSVLKPLGMINSFYTQPPPAAKQAQLTTAYHHDGTPVAGKFHIYPEQAAAGLWTTPTDLARYIIETQLALQGKSSKVLTQAYTEKRLTPYREAAGLGVFITNRDNARYFEHGGSNDGFRCFYTGSFEGGNGVAIMVNSDNGAILHELLNSVAIAYHWKGFEVPAPKKIAKLDPHQWKSLEGRYSMVGRPDAHLQLTSRDEKLILKQEWDGREVVFEAESETAFFAKDFHFPIKVTKKEQGAVTEFLAFDKDVWVRVK
ncbi:serine hydrolase domain-containing protein [Parachryseolinea silvisoli]|uniref:serine hydrolase domain-containing protein n=1 Tax=Parachryseolinea silvisoli TaxID=2873601 RepID=UPI002265CF0C|nr:serine hydrolase domain-containing protein [Parachryseolinea silvisoli]MCD9018435.1 beta-lactamase family protein [Parachryseolinea silvisoli]